MATQYRNSQLADTLTDQIVTVGVASFPVVTLSGGASRRLGTAITTNANTNKAIYSEGGATSGNLLAVTFASALPFASYITEAGQERLALEGALAPGL
jgi:hypothetical protein